MWFLLQALIFFAAMASNIAWHWAPNPYVAALIGVGLAIGATQIVTGIQYLAAVLRRNRRPSLSSCSRMWIDGAEFNWSNQEIAA